MDAKRKHPVSIFWRPVLVVWLILFTLGFGISIAIAPQTRIYEDIICRQYYSRHPDLSTPALGIATVPPAAHPSRRQGPDESRCKAPAIQDAVNELFGWQTFFDGIPGLLLAMYYGSLADRIGRRPILILALVGQALGAAYILYICWIEVDVRLTWFSSAFSCIGGGNTVFTAAGMMILADATPDASRSRIFFYASTFLIVGEMLGPPLGAALMATDPWIPNVIGLLCMALAAGLACLAPETLSRSQRGEADQPLDTGEGAAGLRALQGIWKHTVTTLGFVVRSRNLAMLVATYFTVDFARETLSLIVRYVSARFDIPLAKASYILSFRAAGHLIAYAVLLPLFDALLAKRYKEDPARKDLSLARISIVMVTLGFTVLVFSPGLVGIFIGIGLYTLGTGFQAATKSLLSSMVDKTMVGTVFTTLSLMDTVGALFAGPIDALVMKHALRMVGIWKSLPFMFALGLCAVSTCALAYVRVSDGQISLDQMGVDEETRPFLNRDISGHEQQR